MACHGQTGITFVDCPGLGQDKRTWRLLREYLYRSPVTACVLIVRSTDGITDDVRSRALTFTRWA